MPNDPSASAPPATNPSADPSSPGPEPVHKESASHRWITLGMLAALLIGAVVGELLFRGLADETRALWVDQLKYFGNLLLIQPLKMVLVPLVVASVVVGTASLDPARLGRFGGLTVLYYFTTMAAAVVIGVVLVTTLAPGNGFPEEMLADIRDPAAAADTVPDAVTNASGTGMWGAFQNLLTQLVPANPIGAAANGQILPLVSFSIFVGLLISLVGMPARPVLDFAEAVFTLVMRAVSLILWLAPLGVFLLTAYTVGSIGITQLFGPLALYILTVLLGLAVHAFVLLPFLLWVFGRTQPFAYFWNVKRALLTAFATSSSSATLPVTIRETQRHGGVKKESAEFVLPLGATINMDGTALYEAVAVIFLFQCFGIDLTLGSLMIVAVTATLAAVGAAGIPSAGLVTMVIVIEAVNGALPPGAVALPLTAVGVILGIDRVLDMCRTTVNVWGDAVGAKIISHTLTMPVTDSTHQDATPDGLARVGG